MGFEFKPAVRDKLKLRLALAGLPGSGKTYSALLIGSHIAERVGGRLCVIDTEHDRARHYADRFGFAHLNLTPPFSPQRYLEAMAAAIAAGFSIVVIDSLSHAWEGEGGVLDIVDLESVKGDRGDRRDTFGKGWRKGTPEQNRLIEGIIRAPLHVIATMRTKQGYLVEEGGKKVTKAAMRVVQREGVEYEFTVVGEFLPGSENRLEITKSPIEGLLGTVIARPTAAFADTLYDWLEGGTEPAPPPPPAQQSPTRSAANADHLYGPTDRPMTEPQLKAIYAIARGSQAMDDGALEEWCIQRFGVKPDELSRQQAAETIDALRLRPVTADAPLSQPAAIAAMNGNRTVEQARREATAPNGIVARINDAQNRGIHAEAAKPPLGWDHDALHAYICQRYGLESMSELSREQASGLYDDLKAGRIQAPPEPAEAPDDPPASECPKCHETTLTADGCSNCTWLEKWEAAEQQPELVTVPAGLSRVRPEDALGAH